MSVPTATEATHADSAAGRPAFTVPNVVGLVVAGLLGVLDVLSLVLTSPTPPGEVGPPLAILVLDTALGVVTVVAVVAAFVTRRRGLVRIAAGARLLSMITALPAFFAGVPAVVVAMVSVFTVVTVVAVVLMLLPARRRV